MIPATTAKQATASTSKGNHPPRQKHKICDLAHTLWLTTDPWENAAQTHRSSDGQRWIWREKPQKITVVGGGVRNNDREQRDIKKTSVISQFAVFAAVTVCRWRAWRQEGYCARPVMEDCLLIWLSVFMRTLRQPRYIHSFAARGKAAVFGSPSLRAVCVCVCVCVYGGALTETLTKSLLRGVQV